MPTAPHLPDIARVIQLSVAPVFLLTALGTILGVLSGRLARIVDRARVLGDRLARADTDERSRYREEIAVLVRRRKLVNVAITAGVTAALLVCVLIAAAFIGFIVGADFSMALAVLFIGAMAAFVTALVTFLWEILIAVRTLRLDVG